MSDRTFTCEVCSAMLDEEDLFCPNCGTEAPHTRPLPPSASRVSRHNFTCRGCGASMSYDASAGALRCPFCGSVDLKDEPEAKVLAAERIVPFEIDHDEAERLMRAWLKKGFWRPGDLAQAAALIKLAPVYVPFWVFAARTHTYWTADTSQTPPGARGDWFPLFGERDGEHSDILIGASSALTSAETAELGRFKLEKAVPARKVNLENATDERFSMARKFARPLARGALEAREVRECSLFIPGKTRNVKVNVLIEGLTSEPMLLPVWIMAYSYGNSVFRLLVNGQSGKVVGKAPASVRKIAAAAGIAIAAAILLLLLFGLLRFR